MLGNKIGRLLVFQEWKIISTRITYFNNKIIVSGDPFLKTSQSCNNRVNEPRVLLPLHFRVTCYKSVSIVYKSLTNRQTSSPTMTHCANLLRHGPRQFDNKSMSEAGLRQIKKVLSLFEQTIIMDIIHCLVTGGGLY